MSYAVGPIDAQGAFTADFALPAEVPIDQVPALIERDRAIMATRPGMRQKHLPVTFEEATGRFLSGGRYLFDTFANACAYRDWVEHEFILDGTHFFERPYFIDPVFFAWEVIGAYDFKPIAESHKVIRLERWNVFGVARDDIAAIWPHLRDDAQSRSLASAWLLYDPANQQLGVVSVADASGPTGPDGSRSHLVALQSSASLGRSFEEQGSANKSFDRASWVLTLWFPIHVGEPVGVALWPNSPPLPAPPAARV